MPRPPAELRKLEDEERRRARVHRQLRWKQRVRVGLWILAGVGLLVAIALVARLIGLSLW